jgi:low affinity Fe/Cu permease
MANPADSHSPTPIAKRTERLPLVSKILYRIDHYTAMPTVSISVIGIFFVLLIIGATINFPQTWVNFVDLLVAFVTLIMVFTLQHTQTRSEAATQRKLDELLRALPGASDSLMLLEEAPPEVLTKVQDSQRNQHFDYTDAMASEGHEPNPGDITTS